MNNIVPSGWNLVESAGPFQRRVNNRLQLNLLTVDLTYKKSTDTVIYTRDDRNDVEQFEAKDTYLFRKVLNDGQFVWEATGDNYAKKLLVRKGPDGDPKLTLYYHQPIPGPAAYKTNQRTDNASQRFQPGSLDAYPFGPFPQYVYDPYGAYVGYTGYPGHPGYPAYGAPVPGGSGEMTRPPVIKTSTPVVVMPRRGSRGFKVSDYKRGKRCLSFTVTDNEGSEGERSPTEDERSKRKGHPRDKTVADDDDIEVVEELVSSDETPKKDGEQGEEGKADKKAADTVVTGQDTRGAAAPAEPREDKREPQGAAANLGAGKVDNVVLKDLMDLVKALKNDVDLIKETLKNSDFDTSKLTGTATQKQPAVPALVKEFNATGDSSTIKMYAFGPDGEGAVGIDGSQYGHKLVLTVGDHSNVYILDGNSNTMSVTTAKDFDDDEDEEEGGEGPAVQDVYVNKSVPGAVGTVKGTVPPHSNLFIGGKGVPTPVVVPGLQHTPVQVVKAKPGDSSEDSPSESGPSGTPAAPAAGPGAVPPAAPAPSPVVLAAPATPATPATPAGQAAPATPPPTPATTPPATPAPGKKKLMDDDRDDDDLKKRILPPLRKLQSLVLVLVQMLVQRRLHLFSLDHRYQALLLLPEPLLLPLHPEVHFQYHHQLDLVRRDRSPFQLIHHNYHRLQFLELHLSLVHLQLFQVYHSELHWQLALYRLQGRP
ncbi:hypothetical protein MACJ_000498 [Theileria orientalis]|uniref:Uncharacterized protein n=1 Tax=Theileria orientalis TaxID=68886 RepID=A0A976QRE3_THEOR|nr:hypothetical protein MACJ_000498 [Theileria orientalis]